MDVAKDINASEDDCDSLLAEIQQSVPEDIEPTDEPYCQTAVNQVVTSTSATNSRTLDSKNVQDLLMPPVVEGGISVDSDKSETTSTCSIPASIGVNFGERSDDSSADQTVRATDSEQKQVTQDGTRNTSCSVCRERAAIRETASDLISQMRHQLALQQAQLERKQHEMASKYEALTQRFVRVSDEKDKLVVKYAESEQKRLAADMQAQRHLGKLAEVQKDRDSLAQRLRQLKTDHSQLKEQHDDRSSDAQGMRRELERLKELASSSDLKMKWYDNQLKAEKAAHAETRTRLEEATRKWQESREEASQIRLDCQAQYASLHDEKQQLEQQKSHQRDWEDEKRRIESDLDKERAAMKKRITDCLLELETAKARATCLENEKAELTRLARERKVELETVGGRFVQSDSEAAQLSQQCSQLREENAELHEANAQLEARQAELGAETDLYRQKEVELLELTEKLTGVNSRLQAELAALKTHAAADSAAAQQLRAALDAAELTLRDTRAASAATVSDAQRQIGELSAQLAETAASLAAARTQLAEREDELASARRKHQSTVKELTKQLQTAQRKLQQPDLADARAPNSRTASRDSPSADPSSSGLTARCPSTEAFQALNGPRPSDTSARLAPRHPDAALARDAESVRSLPRHPSPSPPRSLSDVASDARSLDTALDEREGLPITETVMPRKQDLIEKIVKLQRSLARRNEKIEFLEEHVSQLVLEMQRKTRIIQYFAQREEAGLLTADEADRNKAQLARKGGIMASLYNSRSVDPHMTLDLSLNINRKLQAVLEDLILKNLTLKENLETLGAEIARLSAENRQLKLNCLDTASN